MRAFIPVLPPLLAFVLLATSLPAQQSGKQSGNIAPIHDVSGAYTVSGRNVDGSAYSGHLTLAQSGTAVNAGWRVGSDSYSGSGALQDRVLTIDWQPGQAPVIYVVMPNGALHGTWADGLALERATPAQ